MKMIARIVDMKTKLAKTMSKLSKTYAHDTARLKKQIKDEIEARALDGQQEARSSILMSYTGQPLIVDQVIDYLYHEGFKIDQRNDNYLTIKW